MECVASLSREAEAMQLAWARTTLLRRTCVSNSCRTWEHVSQQAMCTGGERLSIMYDVYFHEHRPWACRSVKRISTAGPGLPHPASADM